MTRRVTAPGLIACLGLLAACNGGDPTAADLPSDITAARPGITVEEATYVLDANAHGAGITGATVDDDIETGTTVCWALENGGIQVGELAAELTPQEAPRVRILIAAAVPAFCPDFESQLGQLTPST